MGDLLLVGGIVALVFGMLSSSDPRLGLLAERAEGVGDHTIANGVDDLVVAIGDG